ncbi:phage tail protein [Leptospira johnsonii]|uniref:Tail fiber protein n=1 Tax=Leptospira johnsonii TaxID=1917820 RepID=A0A2P2D1K2_9LEPT|nr:phage tail protein [Leptospira johnsonii]GBF38524.1 hypothetical protein LPTSP1_15170 [Leptospira johnsonii]
MPIPNTNKKVTWSRSTPNDGLLFDQEYTSLYANDLSLQSQVENLQSQIDSLNILLSQTNIPLGAIIEFDFPNIPSLFMVANGQAISRTAYSSLWNLVHRTVISIVPGTDRIQSTSHGLSAGQLVKFSFTGGGITSNVPYFVINPTANDFQISLTKGGAAIDLTATQTGVLLTHIQYGFGDGSTTYNVPDRRGIFARGAGQHFSRAKAAGGNYDGGGIGQEIQDRFQSHRHSVTGISADLIHPDGYSGAGTSQIGQNVIYVLDPISDGPSGAPRIGTETSPASTAVQYVVRVI